MRLLLSSFLNPFSLSCHLPSFSYPPCPLFLPLPQKKQTEEQEKDWRAEGTGKRSGEGWREGLWRQISLFFSLGWKTNRCRQDDCALSTDCQACRSRLTGTCCIWRQLYTRWMVSNYVLTPTTIWISAEWNYLWNQTAFRLFTVQEDWEQRLYTEETNTKWRKI